MDLKKQFKTMEFFADIRRGDDIWTYLQFPADGDPLRVQHAVLKGDRLKKQGTVHRVLRRVKS